MTTVQVPPSVLTSYRRRDVATRTARVRQALRDMQTDSSEITISAVAVRARVHRSFIHRHTELRAEVYSAAEAPTPPSASGAVTRRTLEADNLNLHQVIRRQAQQISDLQARLSEMLGEQAYTRSGLGAPHNDAALQEQILALENDVHQLRAALQERDEDLGAAREAQRQLMAQLNRGPA